MNQPLTPRSAKYRANYEAALAKIDLIDKKAAMSKWNWADIRVKIVGVPGDLDRPAKLFGQDEAVDQVIYGIRNRKSNEPAAFLFVGKPGLGKSQLAKILEKALDLPIVTFDFAKENPDTGPNMLFGGNPQYAGANEGRLILAIKQNPNGLIVLIDEFEKPILGYRGGPPENSPFATAFYGALNDGKVQSAFSNETVDCSKVIFIFTSNLKAPEVTQAKKTIGPLYADGYDPNSGTGVPIFDGQKLGKLVSDMKVILNDSGKGLPEALIRRFGSNFVVFRELDRHDAFHLSISLAVQIVEERKFKLDLAEHFDHDIAFEAVRQLLSTGSVFNASLVASTMTNLVSPALIQFEVEACQQGLDTENMPISLGFDAMSGRVIVQAV
ncbi:hypothetical protein WV31_10345 [Magnetospirillum sp. ME-1]|uniref:AAA family ATPase n=1 Tax=Magnetospirillum sp. ME-1 TaxID=1639348 RepID=UPI000A17D328|nr:AAA family ATPase [Magnetospirillum sp. ME-1]ARJ66026.1 hypothetical protein WV31_10345 [Magnetospirillum sp. ME-1]